MKAPARSSLLAWAALLCALAFVPALFADSQARIVRLSYTDGTVQIDRDTGEFEKAIINMPIIQGTRLVTQQGARAEVEFEDGSTVRLGPSAEVSFPELGLRDDGGKISTVEVLQGVVYFDVERHKIDEFRVVFAGDEVLLDESARFRVNISDDKVTLAVFKGKLNVRGAEEVAVKKNHTLEIDPVNGASELASNVAEDPLDDWVESREDYRARYSSSESYGAPYAGYYGLGDLNYYGNYFYQPGWGWLWRPYSAGFGWDPFYDGAWCWYPGYGYTWVSWYPWGWIPYRYGRWTYVPGWGWGWAPGGWNNWQTVPIIVNPPKSFPGIQPPARPPVIPNPRGTRVIPQPTVIVERRQPRVLERQPMPEPRLPAWVAERPNPRSGTAERQTPGTIVGRQPIDRPARRTTPDVDNPARGTDTPARRVDRPSEPTTPRADRPATPVERPSSPRVERPPSVDRPSAPRIERPSSPPPAPRVVSPPPAAPRSAPSSSPTSRPSGGGRPPK